MGQLMSSIALDVIASTHPLAWRRAVYSEWVPVGLWLIAFIWVTESPWYYARKHDDAKAKKVMQTIYGGAPGYDVDLEYSVMRIEIEHEEALRQSQKVSTYREVLTGANLRRTAASFFGVVMIQWSGASPIFSYATCRSSRPR